MVNNSDYREEFKETAIKPAQACDKSIAQVSAEHNNLSPCSPSRRAD